MPFGVAWTDFTYEPAFVVLALLAALLYARAARRERVPGWKVLLFGLSLVLIVAALNSPLETVAVHYLLLGHLVQNALIADWAPPLLILGLTDAMRRGVERAGGSIFEAVTRPRSRCRCGCWPGTGRTCRRSTMAPCATRRS